MPTTRRDRKEGAPRSLRALTAVAALYALVLQALLGGIAALPVPGAPGTLCASVEGGGDTAKQTGLPAPDLRHAGCCTAANHAPVAAPPPAPTAIAWIERASTRAAWCHRHRPAARPPPFTLAHARASPAV